MSEAYSAGAFQILDVVRRPRSKEHYDWSLRQLGLDKLPQQGEGQVIGILDTGCDIDHHDLQGQASLQNFISEDVVESHELDMSGHGTFTTGQIVARADGKGIRGAAPKAKAIHGKVLHGNAFDFLRRHIDKDIAAAIRACTDMGCGVISMSLGGPSKSQPIESAIRHATKKGVIVVAAAGNERLLGSPYASYPASFPDVISVASANRVGLPAWFSTAGAPGLSKEEQPEVAIASLEYYWGCLPGGFYGKMIGTSMAAPVLASVALLWREAREKNGNLGTGRDITDNFRQWLRKAADDVNNNGWDAELGFGTLHLDTKELEEFSE